MATEYRNRYHREASLATLFTANQMHERTTFFATDGFLAEDGAMAGCVDNNYTPATPNASTAAFFFLTLDYDRNPVMPVGDQGIHFRSDDATPEDEDLDLILVDNDPGTRANWPKMWWDHSESAFVFTDYLWATEQIRIQFDDASYTTFEQEDTTGNLRIIPIGDCANGDVALGDFSPSSKLDAGDGDIEVGGDYGMWFGAPDTEHSFKIFGNATNHTLSFAHYGAAAFDTDAITIDEDNFIGLGVEDPQFGLDQETGNGYTYAKFGLEAPIYINSKRSGSYSGIGFNTYLNDAGSWRFGKGSLADYAMRMAYDSVTGSLLIQGSSSTGAATAAVGWGATNKLLITSDGSVGIGTMGVSDITAPLTLYNSGGSQMKLIESSAGAETTFDQGALNFTINSFGQINLTSNSGYINFGDSEAYTTTGLAASYLRAYDSAGLQLYDDGQTGGLFVDDTTFVAVGADGNTPSVQLEVFTTSDGDSSHEQLILRNLNPSGGSNSWSGFRLRNDNGDGGFYIHSLTNDVGDGYTYIGYQIATFDVNLIKLGWESEGSQNCTKMLTNVAVGSDFAPLAYLHVRGTTRPQFILGYDSDVYTEFEQDSDGSLRIIPTGACAPANLAIGDISPSYKLHVNGVCAADTSFLLPSYTVAGAPSATLVGQMIYVTNETGGAVPAFSDGTNWRRVTDRTIISA